MSVTSPGRLRTIGVIAFAAVFLAACAASGTSSQPRPTDSGTAASGPTPAARFTHITLDRTGGIAGVKDHVDINRDGSWTATEKSGLQKTGTLSPKQMNQLVAAAADPKLSTEATRQQKPTVCRDAFSFALTVDTLKVAYVDCPADGQQPDAAKQVVSVIVEAGAL